MTSLYNLIAGCDEEVDPVWGILWPETNASETAEQKCPGGIESLGKANFVWFCHCLVEHWIGFATRFCDENRMWNDDLLDVSQCQSVEVTNILEDVEALDNETSLSELAEVTTRISDVINSSAGPILPNDLQSTNEILNSVLR